MTKREMVNDLAEAMRRKKVIVKHMSFENPVTFDYFEDLLDENYQYLEESNLLRMKEIVKGNNLSTEFTDLHKQFAAEKLFKVTPKLIDQYPPAIVFRRQAFLSWFRGTNFQVSGTPEGSGDYGSSRTTMRRDLVVAKCLPKPLQPLIAFSHVCEAVNRYEDFFEVLWGNTELINQFMNDTSKYERIESYNFDLDNIKGLFRVVKELPSDPIITVSLCERGPREYAPSIFGMVTFGETFVALRQLKDTRWTMLEFPTFTGKFVNYTTESPVNKDEYYEVIWKRFIHLLVSYHHIRYDFMYTYPSNKKNHVSVPVNGMVTSRDGWSVINSKVIHDSREMYELLAKESEQMKETETDRQERIWSDRMKRDKEQSTDKGMNLF